MKLTQAQARAITLQHQFHRFAGCTGKAGVLDVIKAISYVQLDTISVIQRAHHHTLYNRVTRYHPEMLDELLAKDKSIWEYWGHAASYLPLEDYPYYKIRMQNFPNGTWEKQFWELHKDMAAPILKRIKDEGPLSTKHFEDTRTVKENVIWGNIKPAKIMLELLMWKGDLIVTARDKFQRVYDLTERVIPHYKSIEMPSEPARAEFMVRRTLQAHGIATAWDINNHITIAPKTAVANAIKLMLKKGELIQTEVENTTSEFYLPADLNVASILEKPSPRTVRILSPFDNTVIMRPRLDQLFNYSYALECYVTPAKRKFGYWNCPILYQDNLVGMADPKADRKAKLLILNSIFIQSAVWKNKQFQTAFEQAMTDFSTFNGCNSYSIVKINFI